MSAAAYLTGDLSLAQLTLITRMATLADSVAILRSTQGRAAQAAAARTAACQLRSVGDLRPPRDPRRLRTVSSLAAAAFPRPPDPHAQPKAG